MIELFKYLKGYVCIRVTGFSPERFMNLCSSRGILLWKIQKQQDAYYMCLSIAGFYQLRPIVKKTGTKAVIVKKCGLPFLLPRLWKRKVFIFGFFAALCFWIWTSGFIWAVEIQGNFSITQDVMMDFLKENQVCMGMRKKELDIEALEKNIRKEFYQITWTSVKLNGTKLTVQIKENDLLEAERAHKKEENLSPADLVANQDGVIVSMIVREGVPMVKAGDEVKAGDVLVSGSVPVYQEDGTIRKYQYCRADADIVLEHAVVYKEPLVLNYEQKSYTGRVKNSHYLRIFDRILQPGRKKEPFCPMIM